MLDALKFSETIYGLGAGIFFIGYVLCEVPSNLALNRFGPRRLIALMMITWGTLSTCLLFVTTPTQFYTLRLFTGAAARSLGLTAAAASIALKRLETRLGCRLLARSTRSMRLTEEGRRYLESVRLALATLGDGEQALKQQSLGLAGVLQLSAPSDFGRNALLPWLDAFKHQHPQLRLQLRLNDRHADLFRDTVDVALRFGVPEDSSLVALPILPEHRRVACASPAYLARCGTPQSPEELSHHSALLYLRNDRPYDCWRFSRGDDTREVPVRGDYLCDDGEVARRWALAGHGIVYKARLDVAEDIRAGRLVPLLGDWQGELTPFNLLCPHRLQVSERVRLLHSFVLQRCRALCP